ncbi:MAG TPA: Holliday junction resolvase RuvX [Rhodospirillaceae bacterium]|nr:Holliday junction resolvase RuvX [Rhodospirillaceae bacterium]
MSILSEEEFLKALKSDDRLLGLDIGTKTIGVAFGSMMAGFASPLRVIKRTKIAKDAEILKKMMAEYSVAAFVVGWPLNIDGTVGVRCQATRDVLLEIMKYIPDIPVLFYDERFSTKKAEFFMIDEIDLSRKRRGEIVDKMAAQIILQDFLDSYR